MVATEKYGLAHSIALTRHMKIHEEEPKEYKCCKCEKVFRRKDTLQRHKKMVHRLVSLKVDMADLLCRFSYV